MSVFATRLTKHLLIATTLLLLAQLAVPAQAQTKITGCGTTIKLAGTYVVANDLFDCPGDGIDIAFGHVTLELGNHQITGSGKGTGIRVARAPGLLARNVIIHGPGTISNFDKGIELVDSEAGEVSGVTCSGNNTGFVVDLQTDAWDNKIHDNIATVNHGDGFLINDEWSHYERNQSNGNSGSGFLLSAVHAQNNFVNNNTANQNANDGIQAQSGAVRNLIYENHATGNFVLDLVDDNPQGCPNDWYHNSFGTSNKKCIQ